MRLTKTELAEKYKVPFDVVFHALMESSVNSVREMRGVEMYNVYDEEPATEAIALYTAKKIQESYVAYQRWEELGKRFDAIILGKEAVPNEADNG